MHVRRMRTFARRPHTHIRSLICTFQLLQALLRALSQVPHTFPCNLSPHTHSTGALNLRRRRLLGGFELQILSEDSSNNCKGAEMDTHTAMDPLISDEKYARVCQNFTQIRAFELLKVSQSHKLEFMSHRHVLKHPEGFFFLLDHDCSSAPVVSMYSKVSIQ